jgi:hypothetical protein
MNTMGESLTACVADIPVQFSNTGRRAKIATTSTTKSYAIRACRCCNGYQDVRYSVSRTRSTTSGRASAVLPCLSSPTILLMAAKHKSLINQIC